MSALQGGHAHPEWSLLAAGLCYKGGGLTRGVSSGVLDLSYEAPPSYSHCANRFALRCWVGLRNPKRGQRDVTRVLKSVRGFVVFGTELSV